MSLTAQAGGDVSTSLPLFGNVHLSYAKGGFYTPAKSEFAGRVNMTSKNYDLSCETLTFLFGTPKGKAAGRPVLTRATAKPAAGAQIVADVRRPDALHPLDSQAFHVVADQAVYVPENSRPGGVRVDFTGHVHVTTTAGFLTGPSDTTTDHFTLWLGKGDDYPQFETGPAEISATPAKQ